jgi:hypothetical protein
MNRLGGAKMAFKFKCRYCNKDIIVPVLEKGKVVECKSCGGENVIPETAIETVEILRYIPLVIAVAGGGVGIALAKGLDIFGGYFTVGGLAAVGYVLGTIVWFIASRRRG